MIGGEEVIPERYPYQVALMRPSIPHKNVKRPITTFGRDVVQPHASMEFFHVTHFFA